MAVIRRRRTFGRLFRGIIFLLVSAAVLSFFVYMPFFTLENIKLVGAKYLTQDDILKVGGIYMGEPLFRLETDQVQSRLAKDLRVEEVTVRRDLPHTLEVIQILKARLLILTSGRDFCYHSALPLPVP